MPMPVFFSFTDSKRHSPEHLLKKSKIIQILQLFKGLPFLSFKTLDDPPHPP
jgi:hypothetical protein